MQNNRRNSKDRKRAQRLLDAKRAYLKAQKAYARADKAHTKAYRRYCEVFAAEWE